MSDYSDSMFQRKTNGKKPMDENDRARAGELPSDPRNGARPVTRKAKVEADRVTLNPDFWRGGLLLTKRDEPRRCLANVMHVLALHQDWRGVLAWDAFGVAVVTQKVPPMRPQDAPADYALGDWTDEDTARTIAWFTCEVGFEPAAGHVDQGVAAIAHRTIVHPVRDWLASLEWDGTERLNDLGRVYFGAPGSAYAAAVGRRWMIAAVARVIEPGCKVDSLLGLEGAQGIGKSSALRLLAGAEWFADTGITIGDKDSYQALRRKWIYEFAELSSIRGREIERVKNFLSSQTDTYRPSYGRRTQDHPRQVVFAGSTNDEHYLTDPTGSRRFWPLRCAQIDLGALSRDRAQLWAEAVSAYRAGEPWHLDTAELRALAAEEAAEREEQDDWLDFVRRWLDDPTRPDGHGGRDRLILGDGITTGDVLAGAIGMPAERITPAATRRIGIVLRALGFFPRQLWNGGDRVRRYYRTCDATRDEGEAPTGSDHTSQDITGTYTYTQENGGDDHAQSYRAKPVVMPVMCDADDLERAAIQGEERS
ncbi:MAG TPA: virulence-associated E family protein [Polyangiaceae bacterium]